MARFTTRQLEAKALDILEAALREGVEHCIRPVGTAFALAYLANEKEDRRLFDQFWRALTLDSRQERVKRANYALEAIYILKGHQRPDWRRNAFYQGLNWYERKLVDR